MLAMIGGAALAVFLVRLKFRYWLFAALGIAGGLCAALAGYLFLFPILGNTTYLFAPAVLGFIIWSVLFLRLVLRHTSFPQAAR